MHIENIRPGAIVLLALAAAMALMTWRLGGRDSRTSDRQLESTLRTRTESARVRVVRTRAAVDRANQRNDRSIARRADMRDRVMVKSDLPASARRMQPGPVASLPLSCERILNIDDRLISDLSDEIGQTRRLIAEYEQLTRAYEQELEACSAVRKARRRQDRFRRIRDRGILAIVAAVALVALTD